MPRKLIITTGPSIHQDNVHRMVEKGLDANYSYVEHDDQKNLADWAELADMLMLGGGRDVFPRTYGCPILKGENMTNFDHKRDLRELFLIQQFLQAGKPIVGICRGIQIFSVTTLGFNLTDINFGASDICHQPGANGIKLEDGQEQFTHLIETEDEELWVNSFQHMGILHPGNHKIQEMPFEIEILATAKLERFAPIGNKKNDALPIIIEWLKVPAWRVEMVQWHPENIWEENEASQRFLSHIKEYLGQQ